MRKNIDIPSIARQNQCVILTAKTIKEMLLMCFPLLYNGGIYVRFDVTVVCALWYARHVHNVKHPEGLFAEFPATKENKYSDLHSI